MDRLARYGGLKNRSREMASYIKEMRTAQRPDIHKLYTNVTTCADYLVFHDYYTVDQLRLVKAYTCKKHLLCPFCAARRAAKAVEKNIERVTTVLESDKNLKPVMLTLTVKNGDDLQERFLHLKSSFQRLQQNRRNALKGQKWTEFARVQGGMFSFEITNNGDGWHPHIHMVALLDDWIDQKALSEEWQAITGDSFIVDIRRIKPLDQNVSTLNIAGAMLEVFKYSMKFQDMTLDLNWEAYEVLNKKRLYGSFGNLRGVDLPDKLLDDPLEGLPYLELFYRYKQGKQAYDLETTRRVFVEDCEQREQLNESRSGGLMTSEKRGPAAPIAEENTRLIQVTKKQSNNVTRSHFHKSRPGRKLNSLSWIEEIPVHIPSVNNKIDSLPWAEIIKNHQSRLSKPQK
jgi:plasmid rolling circle replication initiator protein Rep